jgi:PAS domain S-box-containing protein
MYVFALEDFRFLAVNDAAIAHYGYGRKQFLSMTALDIRPPGEQEAFKKAVGRPSRGRLWRHVKSDGTVIETNVFSRLLDYEGTPASLAAAIDVTERNRLDAKLRETQQFLDSIIEHIPVGLVVREAADSRYVLFNKAAEQILSASHEDVLGKTIYEVLPKATADAVARSDAKAIAARGRPSPREQVPLDTPGKDSRTIEAQRVSFGRQFTNVHSELIRRRN